MAKQTGSVAASRASRVLSNPASSASERSAAASALTQHRSATEVTSARAASRAAAVLRDPSSTPAERSAAASALSQRADK